MHSAAPESALLRHLNPRAVSRDAAQRRWNADRSSGVSANGRDRRTFLNASRRAARRPSGKQPRIAGLQTIAVLGIFAGDTVGQGMHMGLPDDQRTLGAQRLGHGGVLAGDAITSGIKP